MKHPVHDRSSATRTKELTGSGRAGPRTKGCLFADERGAAALEYGLIVSLIVIAMLSALQSVASTTTGMWNTVANVLAG
jgi:pilus assembly protein Flp/PilA